MTLLGYITWYYLLSQPLRCGGVYDESLSWIAMDVDAGHAVCGDQVTVIDQNGIHREFIVKDSGPLSRHCIWEDGHCIPIIADIPRHAAWWKGLSTIVTVVNRDMGTRTRESDSLPGGQ